MRGTACASPKRNTPRQHDINKQQLAPNSEYTLNGHRYTTDEHGRIKSVEGRLRLEDGKRSDHAQGIVGKWGHWAEQLRTGETDDI